MEEIMEKEQVSPHIDENIAFLRKELGVGKSFDIIHVDVEYAEIKMALFLVDGLVKDDLLHLLMKFLAKVKPEELEEDILKKTAKNVYPLYRD